MKKFLADGMLRGLLRWLRFLGFDTLEVQPPLAENIIRDAYVDRYFLTNSPGHFQNWKADKKILIPYEKVCQQLNYLNKKLDIFAQAKFLSRCSICNETIAEAKKEDITDGIPENVAKNFDQFYQCPNCKRIYWQGGHVKRMASKLNRMGVSIILN